MNIKIICLGKIKEKFLKDGIDEFSKRLKGYTSLEVVELAPIEIKDNMIEKTLDMEAEKILAHIKPQSYVVTLEIKGKQLDSVEFSKKIEEVTNTGISEMVFIIGSSCGLSAKVSAIADFKMSLSKMTFLHQFTRLLLLEQIYRAFKIMKNETYHK